jgi:hypothetical protein
MIEGINLLGIKSKIVLILSGWRICGSNESSFAVLAVKLNNR